MTNKKAITIDDVYRSLKVHDLEILKHFNDDSLSDQLYLFYAINSDIISNALSIVIAKQTNNLRSIGVDNACRTIIEAFVILKMIAVGDITDEQARIFRYHYAIVDFDNMRRFITDKLKEQNEYKFIDEDRKRAFEAITAFHKCSKNAALYNPDLDNSNFYLKKKLGEKISFIDLLEKYPIFDVNASNMYNFFSLFIHPRFEKEKEINDRLYGIRNEYINHILSLIVSYLVDNKLFVFDEKITTFDEDFYKNQTLENNVENIYYLNSIFDSLENKICRKDNQFDSFSLYFYERMKEIVTDIEISSSLGYKEHIISLFKSTIEYIAVYSCINEAESVEEFKNLKLAYCYSSRLQFNDLLKSMNISPVFGDQTITGLKKIFDCYYKEKYQINNFDSFVNKITTNSRYFLSKSNNGFNAIVNKFLDDLYPDENEREFTKLIYRISKDMNHGGGYAFNSSPGLLEAQFEQVKKAIYRYMFRNLLNVSLTYSKHGINIDLKHEIMAFEALASVK